MREFQRERKREKEREREGERESLAESRRLELLGNPSKTGPVGSGAPAGQSKSLTILYLIFLLPSLSLPISLARYSSASFLSVRLLEPLRCSVPNVRSNARRLGSSLSARSIGRNRTRPRSVENRYFVQLFSQVLAWSRLLPSERVNARRGLALLSRKRLRARLSVLT